MRAISRAVIVWLALIPSGCSDPEEYGSPVEVFEATLGVKPVPSIRALQAYGRTFADTSTCYLKFQVL